MRTVVMACLGWCCCVGLALATELGAVNESAREIPVAYSVDVVVVGGSTGAVSAAVAAANAGAKVFLAAPRSYLGDDMTATLRLWLEEGEKPASPLAQSLFIDVQDPKKIADPSAIPFRYEFDKPAGKRHSDTTPPSLLSDHAWGKAGADSLQFDESVNITLDLQKAQDVDKICLRAYQTSARSGYRVESFTVSTSDDKTNWKEVATINNSAQPDNDFLVAIGATIGQRTRYLRFAVQKPKDASRMLLAEIEVIGIQSEAMKKARSGKPWPRPMHVKRTLDQALLAANVSFLYNCYVTDVLHDAQGNLCGIVMANRAGRQAVIARTIIDATDRATVARLAGAKFRPYPKEPQTFRRVVIGGEVQRGSAIVAARTIAPAFIGPFPNRAKTTSAMFPIIEYTFQFPLAGDTDAAWAKADQLARDATYHPEQQFTSDVLFQVPPDPMLGQKTADATASEVASLPLEAFRPLDMKRLLVLGGRADVPRPLAEKLLRPLALIDLGTRLGAEAASEAQGCPTPTAISLRGKPAAKPVETGDVGELLSGVRPGQKVSKVAQPARALPVLGCYDVVVIGGGTAGVPAGIAAGRQGAKVLVVEQLSGLGGVGTTGAISTYCSGNRVGFTAEVGDNVHSWVIEQRMEWWRSALLKTGADLWFGATGCGTFFEGNRVRGAVVVTPLGRGVVLAKTVIDATGNADVAAAAAIPCVYTGESEFAMQGTGLPGRQLGDAYVNTDYTLTDETDMVDVWHLMVFAKEKFHSAFDLGQLVDTRERRRIVGDYTLTVFDFLTHRTFPDSIAFASSGYDTHGYVVDPALLVRHPAGKLTCYVPYRCLLPRGWDGLLVTGIALSAHRDAQPVVRMQPDIQNQGYAAGVAAAMAARSGTVVRNIDIRALQRHLVEIGNLPESVLTDKDSCPLPREEVAEAVKNVANDNRSVAIVLTQSSDSLPLLRDAYRSSKDRTKIVIAKVLGMLGDSTGLDTLLAELKAAKEWDSTPNWRMPKTDPQFGLGGWITSHLDNTLMAVGRTRRVETVPVVLKWLSRLEPGSSMSHHRAVYLALEWLGDSRAAQPLAQMLQSSGMNGYAVTSIKSDTATDKTRTQATREVMLARALYRCGDWEGLGEKTLQQYAQDLRGHYARHAQAVLAAGKNSRP